MIQLRIPLLAATLLLLAPTAWARGARGAAAASSSAPGRARTAAAKGDLRGAGAAGGGEVVPAAAMAALILEDAGSSAGIAQLLEAAARSAPSLAPALVSQDLRRALGVDPLSSAAEQGLASAGARAIVFAGHAMGFTAPVADEPLARRALLAWLTQVGPPRPTRGAPLKGPLASGSGEQVRAGMVAPVAGSLRLLTASGKSAAALVAQLAHVGKKPQDVPALGASLAAGPLFLGLATCGQTTCPVQLWLRGEAPLLGALLELHADALGLRASGLLLPEPGAAALLEGSAPPETSCASGPLLCARCAPGPALRALAPPILRELIARELLGPARDALDALLQAQLAAAQGGALLRIERLDVRGLSEPDQLAGALPFTLASGVRAPLALPEPLPPTFLARPQGVQLSPSPQLCLEAQPGAVLLSSPCTPAPAAFSPAGGARECALRLDTQALSRSLRPLSALDALRGSMPASAFALKLLYGDLLAQSGPVDLTLRPIAAGEPGKSTPPTHGPALSGALELAFSWPLSSAAGAK